MPVPAQHRISVSQPFIHLPRQSTSSHAIAQDNQSNSTLELPPKKTILADAATAQETAIGQKQTHQEDPRKDENPQSKPVSETTIPESVDNLALSSRDSSPGATTNVRVCLPDSPPMSAKGGDNDQDVSQKDISVQHEPMPNKEKSEIQVGQEGSGNLPVTPQTKKKPEKRADLSPNIYHEGTVPEAEKKETYDDTTTEPVVSSPASSTSSPGYDIGTIIRRKPDKDNTPKARLPPTFITAISDDEINVAEESKDCETTTELPAISSPASSTSSQGYNLGTVIRRKPDRAGPSIDRLVPHWAPKDTPIPPVAQEKAQIALSEQESSSAAAQSREGSHSAHSDIRSKEDNQHATQKTKSKQKGKKASHGSQLSSQASTASSRVASRASTYSHTSSTHVEEDHEGEVEGRPQEAPAKKGKAKSKKGKKRQTSGPAEASSHTNPVSEPSLSRKDEGKVIETDKPACQAEQVTEQAHRPDTGGSLRNDKNRRANNGSAYSYDAADLVEPQMSCFPSALEIQRHKTVPSGSKTEATSLSDVSSDKPKKQPGHKKHDSQATTSSITTAETDSTARATPKHRPFSSLPKGFDPFPRPAQPKISTAVATAHVPSDPFTLSSSSSSADTESSWLKVDAVSSLTMSVNKTSAPVMPSPSPKKGQGKKTGEPTTPVSASKGGLNAKALPFFSPAGSQSSRTMSPSKEVANPNEASSHPGERGRAASTNTAAAPEKRCQRAEKSVEDNLPSSGPSPAKRGACLPTKSRDSTDGTVINTPPAEANRKGKKKKGSSVPPMSPEEWPELSGNNNTARPTPTTGDGGETATSQTGKPRQTLWKEVVMPKGKGKGNEKAEAKPQQPADAQEAKPQEDDPKIAAAVADNSQAAQLLQKHRASIGSETGEARMGG